jgi:undecaprenyl-diphosphatase
MGTFDTLSRASVGRGTATSRGNELQFIGYLCLASVLLVAASGAAFAVHPNTVSHLDDNITIFVNHFAHQSWAVDRIVSFLERNQLAKGCVSLSVFFFVWFQSGEATRTLEESEKRQTLLTTLLMCVPAVLFARILAWGLPFRARPFSNPSLHLRAAYGFDCDILIKWSSFPSDHAVLFFTLATGIALISWRAGLLLYIHAVVFVLLPRLFLGIHYSSDLLAGALLGCGFGYLSACAPVRALLMRPAIWLEKYSQGIFYAGLFFLAMQTAALYDPLRTAAMGGSQVLHALAHQVIR